MSNVLAHAARNLSCDEALRIAHADATQAYRNLAINRISIAKEDVGWVVDYELKDRELQGGGPHYVIDAVTGDILSKRYEQ